jgi:hypothetical protein
MVSRRSRRRRQYQEHPAPRANRRHRRYPLDRWAFMVMGALTLAIGALLLSGDHATARVRDFSWQDRQVGAEDQAFLITFSRPMDPASVEANLTMIPEIPGKISWAGRRMAYTLKAPLPYGESFSVTLGQAQDRFSAESGDATQFEAFQGRFESRKRAFLYIGNEGEEKDRLVLADLDAQERTILTPPHLMVLNFKPYPLGDHVLFSASDINDPQGLLNQDLYTVTTGIQPVPPKDFTSGSQSPWWSRLWPRKDLPPGELNLLLDHQDYQNLKFDLSPDGETIVVQRVSQQNPADFGPWVLSQGKAPFPLDTEPGGDFLIAPDSRSLVMLQGEGTAIIDLEDTQTSGPRQPLDFLPDYGRVFDITSDGTAAAMVNFNQDDPEKRFTESLFLVTNQGQEEELLRVTGAIIDAQFDPTNRLLYVLASDLIMDGSVKGDTDGEPYIEQPMLIAIDLESASISKLLLLPQQQRIHMSLSPDGMAMLVDLDSDSPGTAGLSSVDQTNEQPIWQIPLFEEPEQRLERLPEVLSTEPFPFQGIQATWLP